MTFPFYETIPIPDTDLLIHSLSHFPDLMVLHSAKIMPDSGSYTFIGYEPFAKFKAKGEHFYWNEVPIALSNPFDFIRQKIKTYPLTKHRDLPPFQGGLMGYFGYEANHYLEDLPKLPDPLQLPDIILNFYSHIIAVDNLSHQGWLIATGFPATLEIQRATLAKQQLARMKDHILSLSPTPKAVAPKPQTLESNFSKPAYERAVQATKTYILKGDIFEANISQQFHADFGDKGCSPEEASALYFELMHKNPAPFAAFLRLGENETIISASPERFIQLLDNQVITCPIKGTSPRLPDPIADRALAEALLNSEKDRAENIMIVDLMRNDLSKVCQLHSIQVEALCALQSFATVHHLVSKISAQLCRDKEALDLIEASFPPGSVTGAPKIRAMEVISELEQVTRGPYCGILGYISFTGDMDTSVVIRTYCIKGRNLFFSAGGAVVLDSDPHLEYLESCTKAQKLKEVLS